MSKRATSLFRAGLVAGVLLMVILAAAFGQTSSAATVPSLTIPDLIPADEGQPVVVPVVFDPGTATDVNLMQFDLRYDAQLLDLDPTDSDNNNIADSITVNVPSGFQVSVVDSVNGTTGSILVNLFNQSSPLAGLPAQTLLEITFTAAQVANTTITSINFATNPQPFFANKQGQVISGVFDGGSVEISGTAGPTPSATPSITPSPTITQTPSPTPTQGPLLRSFMPAVVYSFTPTPTNTPVPPTLTPTPKPPTPTPKPPTPTPGPFCGELVLNGGMEDNSGWQININAYPASYVSGFAHSGSRSMRIGIVNWWDNRYSYSSIQQSLTVPSTASSATLRFWLWPLTTGRSVDKLKPPAIVPTEFTDGTLAPLADDVQMVLLFDQAGAQHVLLFQRQNFGNWAYYEMNLDRFRGQRVTLYFGVFNNGTGGITSMYLDDVSLQFCN